MLTNQNILLIKNKGTAIIGQPPPIFLKFVYTNYLFKEFTTTQSHNHTTPKSAKIASHYHNQICQQNAKFGTNLAMAYR